MTTASVAEDGAGQDRTRRHAAGVERAIRRWARRRGVASASSMREEANRPLLSAESTAVRMTRVHDLSGGRNPQFLQGADVGLRDAGAVPRQYAPRPRRSSRRRRSARARSPIAWPRHRLLGSRGLGRGDRDQFRAEVEAGRRHRAGQDRADAVGHEAAVGGEVGEAAVRTGPCMADEHQRPRTGTRRSPPP